MIIQELKTYSPIVVIMHQDSFFVEDEPLDPRLNTAKMLAHFKKAGIQSVSFDPELTQEGLKQFLTIFTDVSRYPSAEMMKAACEKEKVTSPKINHVFFKKVTADEEVLKREEIKSLADKKLAEKHKSIKSELLEMITGGISLENLGKSLSVTDLLHNPERVAEYLVTPDSDTLDFEERDLSPGGVVYDQIHKIRMEVDNASFDLKGAKLHELAESVMQMRNELVRGILEKKENGLVYHNEAQILNEAKEMTDNVILELVKDEYKQGATSINRLSQILRRLIPDNEELQRLLPKLKETLLAEGIDRKSTRLNSSHRLTSRMPSSA
jgi:hypothetical protein